MSYSNNSTYWFSDKGGWGEYVIRQASDLTTETIDSAEELGARLVDHWWNLFRESESHISDPGLRSFLYNSIADIQFYEVAEAEAFQLYQLHRKNSLAAVGDF